MNRATLVKEENYETKYGFHDDTPPVFKSNKGLSSDIINTISDMKNEPEWMRKFRLKSLDLFYKQKNPTWTSTNQLENIDFDNIRYYVTASDKDESSWEDVPEYIKTTFDKLGVPEAEKKYLAGVGAQMDSTVIYHKLREDLEKLGVIFLSTDQALIEYPDLLREYFSTIIPPGDNKYAALNSACWSGGSFIYIPKGVKVDIPLQAYFRINTEVMGQFERTLIIADEDSQVHYLEGCLIAGESISMADGSWSGIEDVKVGDHVLDQNGSPVRVNATQVRDFSGTLFTFKPISPNSAFSVTGEHPLLIVPRLKVLIKRKQRKQNKPEVNSPSLINSIPEWVKAKDVLDGDFLVFPKPKHIKSNINMPIEFARLAGYYLAEGSAQLCNKYKALSFSFHINETQYIEEVQSICKYLYGSSGSVYYDKKKHEGRVLVYTNEGYDAMKNHIGTRSYSKKLSSVLMGQNKEFLKNLVETYMYGDGNVIKRKNVDRKRAHTTSRTWALQLQSIMATLGIYSTISMSRVAGSGEILGRQIMRHALYQVQWTEGGNGSREVRDAGEYFLVPIKKISTRDISEPVYNLNVDFPNSYLASGFVVHNCSSPVYSSESLHSAVVEIIVKKGARVRYTTIQNWSNNVYNLVTKRAVAYEDSVMEWTDFNGGSCLTLKYPSIYLMGERAHGEILSLAVAGKGQHLDAGGKVIHSASNTTSTVVSKSVSIDGGRTSYRGLLKVYDNCENIKSNVRCDALLVGETSRSDTYPTMEIDSSDVHIQHEAYVSKLGEDQLFYLMSRGMSEDSAAKMIVNGFIEPIVKQLSMEYAVELNRLIELQMDGSVG